MCIRDRNLLKQNNEELKETIQQQINGVNNKLDQQKAEIKLILQNYEERNVRQSAKVKLNIETMKEIMSDENQSIETTIEDDMQSVETLNKITEEVINKY